MISQRISLPLAVALVLSLSLSACENGGPTTSDRERVDAAPGGQITADAQPEVSFGYIHHISDEAPKASPPPLESVLDDQTQLQVQDLVVVTSAVELHRCAATNLLGSFVGGLFLSEAHAHVPSSATRHGTPYVEDLLQAPGSARMVGGIAPPTGDYCELHVILTPADDDAINLSSIPPEEIEGFTAMARGRWRPTAEEPWREFLWTSEERRVVVLPLVDPHTGQSPLTLRAGDSGTLLLVDKLISLDLDQMVTMAEKGPDFRPFFEDYIDSLSLYRYQ